MGEWIINIVTFFIQAAIVIGLGTLAALLFRRKKSDGDDGLTLHTEVLNDQRDRRQRHLDQAGRAAEKGRGRLRRALRSRRRKKAAAADDSAAPAASGGKTGEGVGPRVWVLDFHGDLQASATGHFAEEVSAVIRVANKADEVVVRLESGGGLVHAYGLAAAELERLAAAGLATTVCIDKVAASGGYLMACSAGHVKAAPFAVIGSIGVVAQVPNVHRLLKRHDIDVELLTAGKHKRTLTMLGENTEEGRAKFIEDLENTHRLFKDYVARHRPAVDIEALATGEIWYGSEAQKRELVDSVQTSEAYLVERMAGARVISVWLERPRQLSDRLGIALARGTESAVVRGLGALSAMRWHRH
ncbi:protease SohB [Halomonas piscis]|uniref:protease SohB n=1 Tax=Halomonas piscis TaxID=3031727 RepID=UPI00289DEB90|nr:protease SohB [Halomonas piscis]